MNVLLLAHGLPVGGAEVMIAALARWLHRESVGVEVGCLDLVGSLGEALRSEGVPVVCYGRRPGKDLFLPWRIARHVRSRGIEVVHAHQMTPFVYGMLAKTITRVPLILTEHGRFHPDVSSLTRRAFNRLFAPSLDRITAVSRAVRDTLVAVEGFAPDAIEVIYNGIEIERFSSAGPSREEARRQLGIPAGALVVGSVGRLHPDKNHRLLLRSAARLRSQGVDVFVVVVGDGPERAALATLAEDLGISGHATFLGERTDVERILPAFDAFVLPSKTEGTPVTLLEAMAARVPIVAAAVGGIPEILQDGRDGCLVTLEGGDAVAELAAALLAVLSDRTLAHEIAERAFARVQRDFSAPAIFRRYLELYREVVEAGSVGASSNR
jgi:glycosyltransferase involved in cell wall biosynthesis